MSFIFGQPDLVHEDLSDNGTPKVLVVMKGKSKGRIVIRCQAKMGTPLGSADPIPQRLTLEDCE